MRSTSDGAATYERIRDAAIRRFAADGLTASLRAIAADADVSAPLILHYFTSRDGLLEACTQHVLAETTSAKSSVLTPLGGSESLLDQGERVGEYASIIGYVIRLLQAGGAQRDQIIDRLSEITQKYLAEAEITGVVKPSRDPAARARYLAVQSMGILMLTMIDADGVIDIDQLPERLEDVYSSIAGPSLELYTYGLLTNSTLLDAYTAATSDTTPPADRTRKDTT